MNKNIRNQTHRLILPSFTSVAIALVFSLSASADEPKPDAELLRLEAALDAAVAQRDMNIASGEISNYWDRKLVEVEKKIALKLNAEERVQFEASKQRFRDYREKEVEFRASFYSGGSLRPLMVSGEYTSLTKQRVSEMENLLDGTLEPRAENP